MKFKLFKILNNSLLTGRADKIAVIIKGGLFQLLKEIEYQIKPIKSIPRAISLFYIAKREQKRGNKLVVIDDSGNLVSEIYHL